MIIDQNFGSTATIGSIIKSKGGSPVTLLAAEAIKQGIFLMPGKRPRATKESVTTPAPEIGTIKVRTTKNQTRLGGEAGEPGITITYKDGTTFDMTRTRVKETEPNTYQPGKTRPG